MPIASLYVEGDFDLRLVQAILSPNGPAVGRVVGKYQLPGQVKGARLYRRQDEYGEGSTIFGFRDRDFDEFHGWTPGEAIVKWTEGKGGKQHIGWAWGRTEIENYLLDEDIVRRAFGDPEWFDEYRSALLDGCHRLVYYTAIRFALGHSRKFTRLATSCGPEIKNLSHAYPESLEEEHLRALLKDHLNNFNSEVLVDPRQVLALAEEFRSRLAGGDMSHELLIFTSGKDVLVTIGGFLRDRLKTTPGAFLRRIQREIDRSIVDGQDTAAWHRDFGTLRDVLLTY